MRPRKVSCTDRGLPGSPYMSDTPPRIIDPLAEDPPPTSEQHAPMDTTGVTVPDVRGLPATEAIELVREHALIATVRGAPAEHDGEHGLVVDQDPPPGASLAAEAILTLTIAEPPPQPAAVAVPEAPAEDMEVGETAGFEDDTEEWFQALRETTQPTATAQETEPAPDHDGEEGEDVAFDADLDLDSVLAGASRRRPGAGDVLPPLRAAVGVGVSSWRTWRWRTHVTAIVCVLLGMLAAGALESHTSPSVSARVTPAHREETPGSSALAPRHRRRPSARHRTTSSRRRAAAARAPATPRVRVIVIRERAPPPPPVRVSTPPPAPPPRGAEAELTFER